MNGWEAGLSVLQLFFENKSEDYMGYNLKTNYSNLGDTQKKRDIATISAIVRSDICLASQQRKGESAVDLQLQRVGR
ncbi:hypothetical protein Ancab_020458 [Ancistrocladus abbreviatus]